MIGQLSFNPGPSPRSELLFLVRQGHKAEITVRRRAPLQFLNPFESSDLAIDEARCRSINHDLVDRTVPVIQRHGPTAFTGQRTQRLIERIQQPAAAAGSIRLLRPATGWAR